MGAISQVYMREHVLSYADDITLLCPSVWGLNEMLNICNKYRLENNIIFNSKKTFCIKFGSTIIEGESTFVDGVMLEWTDKVRHLGNFVDTTCTDYIDCISKKSYYIVAPSRSDIRTLINVCEQFALDYDITFNGTKSQLLFSF